jgi:hypothetical protein
LAAFRVEVGFRSLTGGNLSLYVSNLAAEVMPAVLHYGLMESLNVLEAAADGFWQLYADGFVYAHDVFALRRGFAFERLPKVDETLLERHRATLDGLHFGFRACRSVGHLAVRFDDAELSQLFSQILRFGFSDSEGRSQLRDGVPRQGLPDRSG